MWSPLTAPLLCIPGKVPIPVFSTYLTHCYDTGCSYMHMVKWVALHWMDCSLVPCSGPTQHLHTPAVIILSWSTPVDVVAGDMFSDYDEGIVMYCWPLLFGPFCMWFSQGRLPPMSISRYWMLSTLDRTWPSIENVEWCCPPVTDWHYVTLGSVKAHAPGLGPVTGAAGVSLKIILALFTMHCAIQKTVICQMAYLRGNALGWIIDVKQKKKRSQDCAPGYPQYYVNAVGFDTVNQQAQLSLLEEIGYLLMYVAVNPVAYQLIHELVMRHHIKCLSEVKLSCIHMEFMMKQGHQIMEGDEYLRLAGISSPEAVL